MKSYNFNRQYAIFGGIVFLLLCIVITSGGCGDHGVSVDSEISAPSENTGVAAISLRWRSLSPASQNEDEYYTVKALGNCAQEGVTDIQCNVYMESDILLLNGPRWDCEARSGRLTGIPVGSDREFVCLGFNGDDIVHVGRIVGIDIQLDQLTELDTPIDFYPFVTENGNVTLAANGPTLTWNSTPNAQQYELEIADDADFTAIVQETTLTETSYTATGLQENTVYFWQVRPIDGHGNLGRYSETWQFTTLPGAACTTPVLDPIGNQSVEAGQPLTFTLTATDPDPGQQLTFTSSALPVGAVFDSGTATFSWDTLPGDEGYYPVTFTVCNSCRETPQCDSEEITISVGEVCQPPVLDPIGARRVEEGSLLTFTINGEDPDQDSQLDYSAEDLPAGAVFYPASQTFSWTPGTGTTGTYTVQFTVCDDCALGPLCDSEAVEITVQEPQLTQDAFIGEWSNVDADTQGITRIIISESFIFENMLRVQAYESCYPDDCDWGAVNASFYGVSPITAVFASDEVTRTLTLFSSDADELHVRLLNDYPDTDSQQDTVYEYDFNRALIPTR